MPLCLSDPRSEGRLPDAETPSDLGDDAAALATGVADGVAHHPQCFFSKLRRVPPAGRVSAGLFSERHGSGGQPGSGRETYAPGGGRRWYPEPAPFGQDARGHGRRKVPVSRFIQSPRIRPDRRLCKASTTTMSDVRLATRNPVQLAQGRARGQGPTRGVAACPHRANGDLYRSAWRQSSVWPRCWEARSRRVPVGRRARSRPVASRRRAAARLPPPPRPCYRGPLRWRRPPPDAPPPCRRPPRHRRQRGRCRR